MTAMFVAMMAAVTGVASASAPNPGNITASASLDGNGLSSTLPVDFFVGDCIEFGGSSFLTARPPVNGVADISWSAVVETTHTSKADIWHGTFIFKDSNGFALAQSDKLDGPPMRTVGQIYRWTIPAQVHLSSTSFALVRKITWVGEC
jgi:hypothetical protein